ncbi:MAG: hypothetical protein ACKOW8_09805 [Flavobacteriales bacterium]
MGKELDEYFTNQIPAATIILSMIGIGAAMYAVIKDTKREN